MKNHFPPQLSVAPPVRSSRLPGLRHGSAEARRRRLVSDGWLTEEEARGFADGRPLSESAAETLIENVIGVHALPLAVATNFCVNGRDVLLPMCVEEPSIVAACSHAARMVYPSGGFLVEADPPWLACQVQLVDVPNVFEAQRDLLGAEPAILAAADAVMPAMVARGGGARALEVRVLSERMLVVHVLVDCRDAMGANLVNTVAEAIAPMLAKRVKGTRGLCILTNLSDRRKVKVVARVRPEALASAAHPQGERVRDAILAAQGFAELDIYRAATHNKGVMNGVDAVLLACGNDFRAVEAGAHAYAARTGSYQPLTRWTQDEEGSLVGELVMPLATSIVGGAARNHPGVQRAIRLSGVARATDLAMLAGAAGLASNLAALRALSTDGIQRGHMALHARRIAAEAGALGEDVHRVAELLSAEQVYRPERAKELLARLTAVG